VKAPQLKSSRIPSIFPNGRLIFQLASNQRVIGQHRREIDPKIVIFHAIGPPKPHLTDPIFQKNGHIKKYIEEFFVDTKDYF
jgi:hypothetical protein